MRHAAQTEGGRLLRLLFLWNRAVPSHPRGRWMLCNGVTLRHLLRFTTEQAAVDIRPFGGARRWRYPTLTHPYPPLGPAA